MTAENQNLSRFDGSKFETVQPLGLKSRNVEDTFIDFQAADGEWWIPAREDLLRYPKTAKFTDLTNTPPRKIYEEKDGLISRAVFSIFQDSNKKD